MTQTFLIVWLSLLMALPIAFGAHVLAKHLNLFVKPKAPIYFFLTVIVIFVFANFFRISFINSKANIVFFAFSYFAFNYLLISSFFIQKKFIKGITLIVMVIPVVIGYLLATVGLLALMAIINDFEISPKHTESFNRKLSCRVIPWGNVTVSGYSIYLYKQSKFILFLEREVEKIVVNESDRNPAIIDTSCSDVLLKYNK